MTSEERREARYQRRKAARQAKRQARSDALGGMRRAFSFRNLFFSGKKCCNGVRWKQSTQNFELHLFSGTARRRRDIQKGAWKPRKCTRFTLCERGKTRTIDAPHIVDRQVHKVLCNEVLTPLYSPSMLYDNGASQKGKGLHWHYQRLKQALAWHFRRYGREGAVLQIDLKGFFPNAPHKMLYAQHARHILDPDLRRLADLIVATVPTDTPGRGMPLGVEASQQEMVMLPTPVDQWIKCQLGIKIVMHYMDDYLLILPTLEEARRVGHLIVRKFESLGVTVNKQKCKVIPLAKSFRFCKAKFQLTETGRIVTHGSRDGMKRARRKFKMLQKEVAAGRRTLQDVLHCRDSHVAYYKQFDDHGRVLHLNRLCYAMFFAPRQNQSIQPGA